MNVFCTFLCVRCLQFPVLFLFFLPFSIRAAQVVLAVRALLSWQLGRCVSKEWCASVYPKEHFLTHMEEWRYRSWNSAAKKELYLSSGNIYMRWRTFSNLSPRGEVQCFLCYVAIAGQCRAVLFFLCYCALDLLAFPFNKSLLCEFGVFSSLVLERLYNVSGEVYAGPNIKPQHLTVCKGNEVSFCSISLSLSWGLLAACCYILLWPFVFQ